MLRDYVANTRLDGDEESLVPAHVESAMKRISKFRQEDNAYNPPSPPSSPSPSPPRYAAPSHAHSAPPSFKQRLAQRRGGKSLTSSAHKAKRRDRRDRRSGTIGAGTIPIAFVTAGLLSDVAYDVTLTPTPTLASSPLPVTPMSISASTTSVFVSVPIPPASAPPALAPAPVAARAKKGLTMQVIVLSDDEEDDDSSDSDDVLVIDHDGGDDSEGEEEHEVVEVASDDEEDEEDGDDDELVGAREVIVVSDNSSEDDDGSSSSESSVDLLMHGRLEVALNAALATGLDPRISLPITALPAAAAPRAQSLSTSAVRPQSQSQPQSSPMLQRSQEQDREDRRKGRKGKKDKKKGRRADRIEGSEHDQAVALLATVRTLHREIRAYSVSEEDDVNAPLALTPTSRSALYACMTLAKLYGLKCKAHGRQRSRYVMLSRGKYTRVADARALSEFFDSLAPPPLPDQEGAGPKREKRSKQLRRERRSVMRKKTDKGPDGAVVGAGAAAIADDNVGHRLLSRMGWMGGGLGREGEGIEEPLMAIMRHTRAGLGSGN